MPEHTGMTAVLVNPAEPAGLTAEQQAKMDQLRHLREELLAQGIKTDFTTGRAPKTELPVYAHLIAKAIADVLPLVQQAMESSDGSVIAFFPQLSDNTRVVAKVDEVATAGRKAYRFATYYPVKAKSGKIRHEGAKFMIVNVEQAAELGVQPNSMVALSYVSYPSEPEAGEEQAGQAELKSQVGEENRSSIVYIADNVMKDIYRIITTMNVDYDPTNDLLDKLIVELQSRKN